MKIYKKPLLLTIIVLTLMVQVILEKHISVLGYTDEIVAVLSILYILINSKLVFRKDIIKPILIICSLILIGLGGNLIYGVQSNPRAILMDIGNMFKGFVSFLAIYVYFGAGNKEDIRKVTLRYLNVLCKILVLPGFILAIVNLFVDISMHTEYIYGLRAFHYIFLRVGNLNGVCAEILMIFTLNLLFISKDKRRNHLFYIGITLLLMISTLRSRAFIYVLLYLVGYWYFIKGKRIHIRMRYFVPAIVVGIWIGWPKIKFYFMGSTRTARAVLLRYGIKTAMEYFPLGAGFGSFGTYAAKAYRSVLYDQYNFSSYYGLSEDYGAFLTDNYWPAIIAEFGFIGAIVMVMLIATIFVIILRNTSNNSISRFAAMFGICRLCIESFVSSSFFHTSAVIMLILTGLVMTNYIGDDTRLLNQITVRNEN